MIPEHVDTEGDTEPRAVESGRGYLGLPEEDVLLPSPAPRPVDLEQIRAMHDRRLSRTLDLELRGLIIAYRDWAEADKHIALERIAASQEHEEDGR